MPGVTRINFDTSTSSMLHWKKGTGMPSWLENLINEFKQAYNLLIEDEYKHYFTNEQGIKYLVTWLKEEGYDVEYWEFPFTVGENISIFGYGIKFKNDCPKFIEAKLRT
jgi:hypothetical protein